MLFGIGALFGTVAHGGYLSADIAIRSSVIHVSWLGTYGFYLAGLVVIIQHSERGRWLELGMDVLLTVAASAVVILRWAPGLFAAPDGTPAAQLLLAIGPISALCGAFLMTVLLSSPPATLPKSSALALAAATISLVVMAVPQALVGTPCCHADSPTALAAAGMWVFVLFAGASAIQAGGRGVIVPQGEKLRQFVAPTVAVVLSVVAIDASINPPIKRATAVAFGTLTVLLALRLNQLLNATRTMVAERRELAQTRALIEVSRALAGEHDLDAALRTVTEWAQKVLNAKAAVIELVSPDRNELVLRAAAGLPPSIVGLTFPLDGSFTGWVVQTGETRVATDAGRDPFIGPTSAAIIGRAPLAGVPLRYRERILGVLACVGSRPFDADDLELMRAFGHQAAIAIEDAQLFEQVRALSVTDALTGLANRRRLDRELPREFAAARRGRRLVAVMFDLDDFKQHNDRYGHLAGDRALRHFAEALSTSTRAMNLAARFGGDEFFALLADTDSAGAQLFVDRVCGKFTQIMLAAGNPVLSISAGIAEFRSDMETPAELIEAADRALYISKSEGGTNR
jgi:diguanylate cyclase (GGDEF)-like protein